MYCKKCGTEQKNGQKFCPKCGEPFVVANETPNQDEKSEKPKNVSDSLGDKAEELSQKGKSFIEEKIQPQIKEKVEDFKNIDWEEKKKESKKAIYTFLSDKDKMRSATIWIAIISVLWFFIFKGGFSASWYWWLFAIAFIVGAFYKIKAKDEADALKKTRLTLICAVVLGAVFIFHSSGGGVLGGEGFLSRRAPIEDFLEKIDLPSTAYMVRIDKNVIRTDVGARQEEVPVGEGNSQDSFEWTIIFFPTDESKKIGRAKVEPWYIDRNAWADGMKISYDYEIRDDRIEFYNGVSFSMYHQSYRNCRDMRLTIENGDDDIQLRGEFADKERVFRLIQYRDWQNKNKHNRR